MFSLASVILFTIDFLDTRSLLATVLSVRILLECFLVSWSDYDDVA